MAPSDSENDRPTSRQASSAMEFRMSRSTFKNKFREKMADDKASPRQKLSVIIESLGDLKLNEYMSQSVGFDSGLMKQNYVGADQPQNRTRQSEGFGPKGGE